MKKKGVILYAGYNDGSTLQMQSQCGIGTTSEGSIPAVGSIILYNEWYKFKGRNMPNAYRGCGMVSSETSCLLLVEQAIKPGLFINTALSKSDFEVGLLRFVVLKEFVFQNQVSYKDMDIDCLSPNIVQLVVGQN